MRDEEKENLFRALNDVRNLMQQDDVIDSPGRREPKFNAREEDDILELAGHEIHDFQEAEESFGSESAEEMVIEEILLNSEDDQFSNSQFENETIIAELNPNLDIEDEVNAASENSIKQIFKTIETGRQDKAERSVDIDEIIQQTARPYIIKWLDENLESLVRGVVELEIAKIMKKAKK